MFVTELSIQVSLHRDLSPVVSLAVLRRIASARRFPVVLISDTDVQEFRALLLAGQVVGAMQATPAGGGWQVGVHVIEITPKGKRALAAAGNDESGPDHAASPYPMNGA